MKAKGLGYGYTDFSINNDSIFVYNKELGEQPELKYAFKANAEHKPYVRQQDESFAMPENFTIERVYQDYASIFTTKTKYISATLWVKQKPLKRIPEKTSGHLKQMHLCSPEWLIIPNTSLFRLLTNE